MAKSLKARPLTASLLDRLLDDDPALSREPAHLRHPTLAKLKQDVRRDLESLLNTRVRNVVWSPKLDHLDVSLLNYGLPDYGSMNLAAAEERQKFCRLIENVILAFEPRLMEVKVVPHSAEEPLDRTFRFRIEALLRVDPAPEPVLFDSHLDPGTGNFDIQKEVQGARA